MVFANSYLFCADNSGTRKVKCVNVNGQSRYANIGGTLTIIVLKGNIKKKLFKKKKYTAHVVSLKRRMRRFDGTFMLLNKNKVILFDRERKRFVGNRAFGCVAKEIRYKKKNYMFKRFFSTFEAIL